MRRGWSPAGKGYGHPVRPQPAPIVLHRRTADSEGQVLRQSDISMQTPWRKDAEELLHLDLVALAVFAGEEGVGLGVAGDFSFAGIPGEFSAQAHGDIREVADFQHAVM